MIDQALVDDGSTILAIYVSFIAVELVLDGEVIHKLIKLVFTIQTLLSVCEIAMQETQLLWVRLMLHEELTKINIWKGEV